MTFLSNLLTKRGSKEEAQKLAPEEFFNLLKEQKEHNTELDLKKYFVSTMEIAERMRRTHQTEGLRRLNFLAKTTIKEVELVKLGYNEYIWKRKLDELLDDADTSIKICELEEFTRPLPEEAVKAIEETENIFSAFFVMFTDYTGREDRRRETEQRNKDPILFGAFVEEDDKHNIDFGERMYPLYSWKDEYCELTLDELCAQYEELTGDKKLVEKLSIKNMHKQVEKRLAEFNIQKDSSDVA